MSTGRKPGRLRYVDERPPADRTETERDCDRILYCSAFQRLSGITQVTSPEAGHVLHNRLTHSLKVSQVGRRLVERLQRCNEKRSRPLKHIAALNADVVAAAGLAHDLGHPPFGHIAELELQDLAADWGSYEGNAQSFRIVTRLAGGHAGIGAGLNLTRPTLNAILKYPTIWNPASGGKWGAYVCDKDIFKWARKGTPSGQTMEASIMDWADDVTYAVHDVEDFHRAGLIPLDRLNSDSGELKRFISSFFDGASRQRLKARSRKEGLDPKELVNAAHWLFDTIFANIQPYDGSLERRASLREATSLLIDRYIRLAVNADKPGPIKIELEQRHEVAVLKELTWFYLIETPSLATLQQGQRQIIRDLHGIYQRAARDAKKWSLFPPAHQERLRDDPDDMRVVTDFIAGLTETAAYELHGRLTGRVQGSVFDAVTRSG